MNPDVPPDLMRVQEDLAAMREVLGTEAPFGRPVPWAWLGVAGVSMLALIAEWTASVIAVGAAAVLSVALIAAVMCWMVRARAVRRTAPVTWREVRMVAVAKLTGGLVLAVILSWFWHVGLQASYVIAFAALCIGLATLVYATTRPWRRVAFGFAIPLLAFGAAVPIVPADRISLTAAAAGLAAGLGCAGILYVEIRLRTAARR